MPYSLGVLPSEPVVSTAPALPVTTVSFTLTDFCARFPTYCFYHKILATTGCVLGIYHGYRRNKSIGWALGWGVLGAVFPYVTLPISVAQGFGKPRVA